MTAGCKVKATLSSERLAELLAEAQQLVRQENPDVKFGEQVLIELKIDELIRTRHL